MAIREEDLMTRTMLLQLPAFCGCSGQVWHGHPVARGIDAQLPGLAASTTLPNARPAIRQRLTRRCRGRRPTSPRARAARAETGFRFSRWRALRRGPPSSGPIRPGGHTDRERSEPITASSGTSARTAIVRTYSSSDTDRRIRRTSQSSASARHQAPTIRRSRLSVLSRRSGSASSAASPAEPATTRQVKSHGSPR